MSNSNTPLARFRAHYDKAIAVLVMVLLLISLVYLAWKVGSTRKLRDDTLRDVESLMPDYEFAAEIDTAVHDGALAAVAVPIQLETSGWTNRMLFVPESRVTCTACGAPRPISSLTCPWTWCGYTAPTNIITRKFDVTTDTDEDEMYDVWERQYRLDPKDPADAALDGDLDTFSNLEEFLADPQTDPTEQASRPSFFPNHVVVQDMESHAFLMVFRSKTRNIHGAYRFGLNYQSGGETITKFVKLNETFAGFTVKSFEPKEVRITEPYRGKVDRSELTLVKGKLTVVLVYEQKSTDVDRSAVLAIPRVGKVYESVREGERIKIDGHICKVSAIDTERRTVVLIRESDGRKITISERNEPPRPSHRFNPGT